MKLVNRIFFSVFGLLIFSTLASTITGAVLISDAVRSEAGSRVELGLKEARSELEYELEGLRLSAQILAQGLEDRLNQTTVPDIAAVFPDSLPPSLLVARSIVRPLSSLAEASAQISLGRFESTISAQRGAQEIRVLAEAFQSMKEAIREREERLKLQNQDLETANKDYQELLSFVTHELNNSLGSLLLNVSLLAEDLGNEPDPQGQLVEQIVRDVERFRDMVENYLNLSRLEKGTLRFNPEPLDVRLRVIEPVLERLKRWITHKEFVVHWEWPEQVSVYADATLLDIVFSNFIVNALKYGREWIAFSARREGEDWLLAVANGGTPIPREKIPLLFQKFSRLVGSSDGAGLGLYLVRKIVERHGGEVWCESISAAEPAPGTPAGAGSETRLGAQPGTRFCLRLRAGQRLQAGTV